MHYCPTCRHRLTGFGCRCGCGHTWTQERFDTMGFDVTDGDFVVNLGDGLGFDPRTGEMELELGDGIDVPLDGGFGGW